MRLVTTDLFPVLPAPLSSSPSAAALAEWTACYGLPVQLTTPTGCLVWLRPPYDVTFAETVMAAPDVESAAATLARCCWLWPLPVPSDALTLTHIGQRLQDACPVPVAHVTRTGATATVTVEAYTARLKVPTVARTCAVRAALPDPRPTRLTEALLPESWQGGDDALRTVPRLRLALLLALLELVPTPQPTLASGARGPRFTPARKKRR